MNHIEILDKKIIVMMEWKETIIYNYKAFSINVLNLIIYNAPNKKVIINLSKVLVIKNQRILLSFRLKEEDINIFLNKKLWKILL